MSDRVNYLVPDEPRWPRDPARPVIQLRDVRKSFGDVTVLDGVNLDIHTGLTTVIAGESGSGKSVLLKMMNGLMTPDSGQVLLFGEDIAALGKVRVLELRKRVTMMFQNYALMDSRSVIENVGFPLLENTRMKWKDIKLLCEELLELLDLGDAGDKLPSELSGGMKKRVSLARAVITNPEIVLFDEPTTGLDPIMIDFVDKMLIETRERFGITSVVISHDMTSTLHLADRVAILEGGRISAYGTVDEVMKSGRELVDVFFSDVGRLNQAEAAPTVAAEARRQRGHGAFETPVYPLAPGERAVCVLTGVHKHFGPHHVLRGVDLVIPEHKISVIIGASGSGKSVIMKHIIGLFRPDSGSINVFGQELTEMPDDALLRLRERYGMVFQGAALLDALNVRENVLFPMNERGVSKAEAHQRADEVLEQLRIQGIASRMPSTISNGQKKRVALARAIVTRPELVIYDEPTTGQDPVMTRYLDDMIVEAQELFDVTSLVVSHDMPSAFRIADQIALLHRGRMLAASKPDDLVHLEDPLVRQFIFAGTAEGERAAQEIEAAARAAS